MSNRIVNDTPIRGIINAKLTMYLRTKADINVTKIIRTNKNQHSSRAC